MTNVETLFSISKIDNFKRGSTFFLDKFIMTTEATLFSISHIDYNKCGNINLYK